MSTNSNSITHQSNAAIAAFLELSKPPALTPLAAEGTAIDPTTLSTADYILNLFYPDDLIAIMTMRNGESPKHLFAKAKEVASIVFLDSLHKQNDAGCHIYVCMNPLTAKRRVKENVACIRTVYLDIDYDGVSALKKISQNTLVRKPNAHVIHRSETTDPDGTIRKKTSCDCNAGFTPISGRCVQIVPNLASDPNASRLSAAELRLFDGRIATLHKAIALLGDSNPEWARERKRVLDAMHEDAVGVSWEGVNLLSIGLTELAKRTAQAHLSDMHINVLVKAFKEPLSNLPSEEARLNRILAATQDPALTKAILEYTAALHRLSDAQYSNDVVRMVARTLEGADALKSEFEILKTNPQSPDVGDGVYLSSAFVGSVAIIFVAEGPEALAAAAGSAVSSIAVGGRELVNLWQERGQLAALDQNTSDRNRMRARLEGRLNELQQQHDTLVWAVQHAAPADSAR
jgi:hypothetical protein